MVKNDVTLRNDDCGDTSHTTLSSDVNINNVNISSYAFVSSNVTVTMSVISGGTISGDVTVSMEAFLGSDTSVIGDDTGCQK